MCARARVCTRLRARIRVCVSLCACVCVRARVRVCSYAFYDEVSKRLLQPLGSEAQELRHALVKKEELFGERLRRELGDLVEQVACMCVCGFVCLCDCGANSAT